MKLTVKERILQLKFKWDFCSQTVYFARGAEDVRRQRVQINFIPAATVTGILAERCIFGAFSVEEDQRVFWHQF